VSLSKVGIIGLHLRVDQIILTFRLKGAAVAENLSFLPREIAPLVLYNMMLRGLLSI
jgi:hypothetical protein